MNVTNEHDVKTNKALCATFAVILISAIIGIAGYHIHSTAYESQNLAAEVELVRAQAESETKQSDAIQYLIDGSVNPIAARCAIVGWRGPEETTICALFTKDVNVLRD